MSVPGATANLCGNKLGYKSWSIARSQVATIVRWIGDSCQGPDGLTTGTASKADGISNPMAYQIWVTDVSF